MYLAEAGLRIGEHAGVEIGLANREDWKMRPSMSMPAPQMIQAMPAPTAPAREEMVCGTEKIPPPIIEPTTSAVSTGNDRLEDFSPSVLIDA